jgi:hypothetical protein
VACALPIAAKPAITINTNKIHARLKEIHIAFSLVGLATIYAWAPANQPVMLS